MTEKITHIRVMVSSHELENFASDKDRRRYVQVKLRGAGVPETGGKLRRRDVPNSQHVEFTWTEK